ncbi:Uncharacterised protein [uncultured archaeon]|nr:Uncharacterised protein [uncultured archaeon]
MVDWKNVGIAAVAMTVVAQVVHTLESIFTMGYYSDPNYFSTWSKLMMPTAGPPPASFFAYSIAFALVGWALFSFAYAKLGSAVKEKDAIWKGLKFGALVFLVAGIPGTLTMYLLINIPVALLVSWMLSGLALYLVGGIVAAKLIKPE